MLGLLPLSQLLASASYDDTVKLYREEDDDWVCFATLEGHESTVWSLAFDPSGQRLASCSDDRTVRIWRQYLPGNEQGEGPVVGLKETLKGFAAYKDVCKSQQIGSEVTQTTRVPVQSRGRAGKGLWSRALLFKLERA